MVAGGSSGIGLGCAVALAEAGAHVVIMARRSDLIDQMVTAMQEKGLSAEGVVADITDVDTTAALIARLRPFDVFVNSAGLRPAHIGTRYQAR